LRIGAPGAERGGEGDPAVGVHGGGQRLHRRPRDQSGGRQRRDDPAPGQHPGRAEAEQDGGRQSGGEVGQQRSGVAVQVHRLVAVHPGPPSGHVG
jgi:hypothetical protein